jgi:hypothetical protein
MTRVTEAERASALAEGRWMLRFDQDGVGYGGFRWPEPGVWIEADN